MRYFFETDMTPPCGKFVLHDQETLLQKLFFSYTVQCHYGMMKFFQNTHKKTPHSSPFRASYGVSFSSLKNAGLILGLRPANERRRYKVTPSLIGRAQT